MAVHTTLNFLDCLDEAESALNELVNAADRLATRLVGPSEPSAELNPAEYADGILGSVANTAVRLREKAADVRLSLRRIEDGLPPDVQQKKPALASSGQIIGGLGPRP